MNLASTISRQFIGRLQPEALPERIQKLIRAREEESERLIGWVQLGLVIVLAALFFIAPRPTDAGVLPHSTERSPHTARSSTFRRPLEEKQ